MRPPRIIAALAGLFVVAAPAFAQSPSGEAYILQPEVEVRSGPGKGFYATSRLIRNDKVYVMRESKEQAGWLEIKPPVGSFSWINAKHVRQIDARYGVVKDEPPVPTLPGSTLADAQAPNRESIKLSAGTQVVIVAQPNTVNGETWLPIAPHPLEVRYIPADAVKLATAISPVSNTPVSWQRTPDNAFTTNNALAEAEKARAAGDVNSARQLYQRVVDTSLDQNQKVYAMQMLARLPQAAAYPPVQATTTSLSPANVPAPGNLVKVQDPAWYPTYGRLRETKLQSDYGQPLYYLEDGQGKNLIYVTTNAGKSLVSYVGRTVTVYGPTMLRPDMPRMQYIVATHVAMP